MKRLLKKERGCKGKDNIEAVTEKAAVEEKRRKGRLQKKGERKCC